MTGLPTILVELDDGTGTFPYNITADVRLEGSGYSLNRGREDTQAAVTAGSLTMTLKNHDGKYSFNSTVLDSPSPIVVDQKIRIKETINATTFTRFTGYVKSWPTAWPGAVDTFSLVNLTASDAQARGERKPLRSFIVEEVLADLPAAYYKLDEPEGSTTAADSSGSQAAMLTMAGSGTDVVFSAALNDAMSGAQFAGGSTSTSKCLTTWPLTFGALECFFVRNGPLGGNDEAILTASDGFTHVSLSINSGSESLWIFRSLASGGATGEAVVGSPDVADNAIHHVFWDVTSGAVYLDGALLDSGSGLTVAAPTRLVVGGGAGLTNTDTLLGGIAHAGAHSSALAGARIAAHYAAGADNFDGESGTDRITRLAGYASIPVGALDPSLTNVSAVDTSGVNAWPAIQDTVDAEGGLAYINGSGNLIFFNRHDAPGKTAPDITLSATFVRPDAQPTGDDESLKNYFAATAQGTGVEQVVRDEASELAHGQYPDSKTYLVQTDAEALDRANWIIGNYAEPTTRWPSMTLLLHKMTAAQAAAALAIEPGTWLRVTDFPSQTPDDTTVDVMVEGIAETCSSDEWTLTLNVVARELFQAWILGDSTYGVLGSTTRLGV